jgi:AraC family transcriptional regulator
MSARDRTLPARRVAAAKRGVLDVAVECGFNSHSAFNRAYREVFGCTPTQHRTACSAG